MELSEAIDLYHGLLDEQSARETFEQLDAAIRARGLLVGKARDRLICSVLRPRLLVEAQLATLERAATLVGRAIRKVGAAALQEPALLKPYALTAQEQALLAIDPGYAGASAFGRLDGFLAADGSTCWFVESNLESPAGIGYDEAMVEIFDQLPIMGEFRKRVQAEPLPHRQGLQQLLLETYHAWGGDGTPTIAIVDFREAVTMPEFEHLRERFEAAGIPTVIADPGELEYDGKRLYARIPDRQVPVPIDLVYRRVLQHEFLARYDLEHPLVRAYADRAACVANPFRTKPVHTKLIMALLSDEDGPAAGVLDAEERVAVREHVPWTRQVLGGVTRYEGQQVPLLTFAQRNREQLVLKPNDDYGGQGVLLGWETDQASWDRALAAAQAAPFVVQERVPLPAEDYPTWTPGEGLQFTSRYVDSDPCVYGDRGLGCLTRIAATSLLNVSAGGGAAPPTFVVAPAAGVMRDFVEEAT
ncbi:MAG TPA: hypothetical protein VFU22_29110 [Roseiflexaceae bacterium]|nr:hypothetical protein [Roseiflexaceae bacterium]